MHINAKHEYTNTEICTHTKIQTYEYTYTRNADKQINNHAHIQNIKHTHIQIYKYTSMHSYEI